MTNYSGTDKRSCLDLEPVAQTLNHLVESLLIAFLVPTFKLALRSRFLRTNLTKFTIADLSLLMQSILAEGVVRGAELRIVQYAAPRHRSWGRLGETQQLQNVRNQGEVSHTGRC